MSAAIAQSAVVRQFRERREPEWLRLEGILEIAEGRSVRALSDDDLLALPVLYRGALSSLSLARETSLDLDLITYLEGLCARAYFFVYGVRSTPGSKFAAFFKHGWPEAVQAIWRESLAALLLMAIGLAAGFILVANDPSWYDSFMNPAVSQGRNFEASDAELRRVLYHEEGASGLTIFSSFLFTNNAGVSLLAFALGFAFGIPTAMLLIHNLTMLGALLALYASRDMAFELGGWLSIHGTTELFAILLAGAAGFRIGWSVVFPGDESRLVAATRSGKTAAKVMVGVVIMLMVAAFLEGFGRQLIENSFVRYGIGLAMLLLWLAYFYVPRGRANG
ncbi:MAG TPA: stage II sporulation protein M [Allosphingosinicella sp.]